jgi:hypothetical protein
MRYLWYSMYAFATALALYALFFRGPSVAPTPTPEPVVVRETPQIQIQTMDPEVDIQIALILDTSSSMDGLVEQARTQLWEMVSEMQVDDDGSERTVAVSLYQYGNSRIPKREGFIENLTPLTTDLDLVTVKLYDLRTSGGKEYAPQAIKRAVEELNWNKDDSVQKLIVIAGNEGFGQGPINSRDAFALAASNDIAVLPIYCANKGASKTAIASWRGAATLAGAEFDSIDPDQQVAKIESPFDAEIIRKYRELEETKIYAEGAGQSAYSRQAEGFLDKGVAVDRAVCQSRQASSSDLVNVYGSDKFDSVAPAAMPQSLRGKSKDEQREILGEKQARQQQLKKEITELNNKRQQHINDQMEETPGARTRRSSLGTSFRKNAKGVLKSY